MYLTLSLLVAVAVTLFVVSKFAKMLLAKRPNLEWITLASIVSAVIAVATYITLNLFVTGLEPMTMLGITFSAMILLSSIAFKIINKMSWGAAIATNVANIVIMLATSIAAIVINGEPLNKIVNSIAHTAKTNTMMVSSMVHGSKEIEPAVANKTDAGIPDEEVMDDNESEPTFTELELLPKGAITEAEKKQKPYAVPKYHVVSIDEIKTLIGKSLKIQTTKGSVIRGFLQQVNGGDAILDRRINGGTAITPIALSAIKKLEVYR